MTASAPCIVNSFPTCWEYTPISFPGLQGPVLSKSYLSFLFQLLQLFLVAHSTPATVALEILNAGQTFPPQDSIVFSNRSTSPPYTAGFLLSSLNIPQRSSWTHTYHRVLSQDLVYFLHNFIRVLIIIFHHDDLVWGGVCLFVSVCMACKILVSWPWMWNPSLQQWKHES